jgi:putative MATE family efflux protein
MATCSELRESSTTLELGAKRSHRFVGAGIPRLLLQSSLPVVVAMSAQAFYNVVDRIFVARAVGSVGIAAVTVALPITLAITALATLFGCGAAILISMHLGRQDCDEASRVLGRTIVLLSVGGVLFTAVGLLLPTPFYRLLGAGDMVLPCTIDYSRILFLGAAFQAAAFGLNAVLRAEGCLARAMLATIASLVVKVLLAHLFMFVFRLGIVGAALATVGSQAALTMWQLEHFCSTRSSLRIHWKYLGFDRRSFLSIAGNGSSACVIQVVGVLVNCLLNYQMYAFGGDLAVSASGVRYAFFLLIVMPTLGIAQGAQPIYGYNLGAKRLDRVRQTLWAAVCAVLTLTSLASFAALALPSRLVDLFHPDDSTLAEAASHAIQISMSTLPLLGFQIVGTGYFQAIGKVKRALFLTFVRQLLLVIPALLLLPRWFGLDGVWAAVPAADALAAGLTAVLLFTEHGRGRPIGGERVARKIPRIV